MKIITKSAEETRKVARKIAKKSLSREKESGAIIFALKGDLGSGKTTFAQGFADFFGIKKVNSPTFVIMKRYDIPEILADKYRIGSKNLYHIDCYRVKRSRDLSDIGIEEIINNNYSIILIEWADKVVDILPQNIIRIEFKHIDKEKRLIDLKGL